MGWAGSRLDQGPLHVHRQPGVQTEAVGQIQGRMGEEHLGLFQLQLGAEVLLGVLPHFPLDFQPHRRQPQPLFQDFLHMLAVVGVFVQEPGVGVDVGVAGDADHRLFRDLVLLKNLVGEVEDHILHQNEPPLRRVHHKDPPRHRRHRNDPEDPVPLRPEGNGHIQLLVADVGEGVALVDDLGGQHRQDLPGEKVLHQPLLGLPQLAHGDVHQPRLGKLPVDPGKRLVPEQVQRHAGPVNLRQLLRRRHSRFVVAVVRGKEHVIDKAPHPDHEKLVQIAGEDRQKVKPFQQGRVGAVGLLQHPLVEFQPGKLPVLHTVAVVDRFLHFVHRDSSDFLPVSRNRVMR